MTHNQVGGDEPKICVRARDIRYSLALSLQPVEDRLEGVGWHAQARVTPRVGKGAIVVVVGHLRPIVFSDRGVKTEVRFLESVKLPALRKPSRQVVRIEALDGIVDPGQLPEEVKALATVVACAAATQPHTHPPTQSAQR